MNKIKPNRAELKSRLINYKFSEAVEELDESEDCKEVVEVVNALAAVFGDVGWGLDEGHMGTIVEAALHGIGAFDEDEDEH